MAAAAAGRALAPRDAASAVFDELVRSWEAEVPSGVLRLLMGAIEAAAAARPPPDEEGAAEGLEAARRRLLTDVRRARRRCGAVYAAHGLCVGPPGPAV